MSHLSPDELVDLVDGALASERQAHVDDCAECAARAAQLGAILHDAKDVAVPEPSPLFWTHLSSRVQEAIRLEQVPRTHWLPEWLRWPVLAPIGALALLILVLVSALPEQRPVDAPALATASEEPVIDMAALGDSSWDVVSELVGPVDLDAVHDAGIVPLGAAERAALQLSVDEQEELLRLLQEEMGKTGS